MESNREVPMSTRLQILVILSIIVILPFGCSETTTAPEEEERLLPAGSGFEFDYRTDDALAVSGYVTPAGGGTIGCTGANGVTYSLEVWPGAVATTTTVTMTPLEYLTISEIQQGVTASAPVGTAEDGCNVGVWLEPAGLEFDSTVVLTITFPDTVSCGVTGALRGVFIDPDRTFYTIMPTDIDTVASVLACTLSHFSIYGTDDVTYEYLKTLIEETTEYGLEFPTLQVTTDLMVCVDEAGSGNWPDLAQLAINGTCQILNKLAVIVNAQALASLSRDDMRVWATVFGRVSLLGCAGTDSVLYAGSTAVVEKMISTGKQWCGSDREEEGRAMLWRAWEYINYGLWRGFHPDGVDAKAQEVLSAHDACADVTITVFPQDEFIYDWAMNEYGTDTYTQIEVEVQSESGMPVEDQSVFLSIEHLGEQHYYYPIGSKQTDSEGKATYQYGYKPNYGPPEGHYRLSASTHHNGKIFKTTAPLELRRRRITLNYSYLYSYSKTTPTSGSSVTATYTSSGTRASQSSAGCDTVTQSVVQSSWVDHGNYTSTSNHNSEPMAVSACFYEVFTITHHTDDEFRTPYFTINKLSVGMRGPVFTRIHRVIFDGVTTDEDILFQDAVDYFHMVYPPYPESHEVFLEYDGGFVPYSFSGTSLDGFGSAALTITAELEEDD
jgi:hypothetical protein